MARLGEDVVRRCSRASRSLVQNVEQVVGGSSLVGTYQRTRGMQRWGEPAAGSAARSTCTGWTRHEGRYQRQKIVVDLAVGWARHAQDRGRSCSCAHHGRCRGALDVDVPGIDDVGWWCSRAPRSHEHNIEQVEGVLGFLMNKTSNRLQARWTSVTL
jgi:hypothetical protein